MAKINLGRVVMGGILAGIVSNTSDFVLHTVVLKSDWVAAMTALGKSSTPSPTAIPIWIAWSLCFGIGAVWLYAAIRPRYGPGPATAVRAGIAAWFFARFLWAVATYNMGFVPNKIVLTMTVWTFVEAIIATQLGALVYKETS
jgi:hypothetical protein